MSDSPGGRTGLGPYVRLARPDNWFKNIFILPGVLIAFTLTAYGGSDFLLKLAVGLASACLIASANYVVNEWLDRKFDRFHPVKKNRPSVSGFVEGRYVAVEYLFCAAAGLALARWISTPFLVVTVVFLVQGLIYNVEPIRTKDRVYLDVLSESINNPIRLLLGWFLVDSRTMPPGSLLVAYWMGGAYLMGIKRYSEFRFIGDAEAAGKYRRSFQSYTDEKLMASSLFYALCAMSLGGVFLVKYRIELVLTLPLYALMFVWYFVIGLKPNSAAQHPEKMHEEHAFIIYVCSIVAVTLLCLTVRLPILNDLFLRHDLIGF